MVVATGSGRVFGGDTNGRFWVLDDEAGEVLWEINLGSPVTGPPITYAVDGQQYVAVSTGSAAPVGLHLGVSASRAADAWSTITSWINGVEAMHGTFAQ